MKIRRFFIWNLLILTGMLIVFTSCEKTEDEPTPTHTLMQGVWELTLAYDENDSVITDQVTSFYPTYIHLDDMNSVNSTAGPLFMYIVYGDSRFIEVASKLGQLFSYTNLTLTEGEWFIDKNEVVDNFTIEMKLKFPTMDAVTTIFEALKLDVGGLFGDIMDAVIYHRFKYVKVEVSDENSDRMTWNFTDASVADYNTKDEYGDKLIFTPAGVNGAGALKVDGFSRCKVILEKRVKTVTQLCTDYNEANP